MRGAPSFPLFLLSLFVIYLGGILTGIGLHHELTKIWGEGAAAIAIDAAKNPPAFKGCKAEGDSIVCTWDNGGEIRWEGQ